MSKARLKKALKDMTHDQIAEMVMELYDARKEAKAYLEYWLDPDIDKELERRKTAVRRLFFTTSDKPRKLPTATAIKAEVKDFTSICYEPEKTADLLLYICDSYAARMQAKRFGHTVANAAEKALDNARTFIEASGLDDRFSLRLDKVRQLIEELTKSEREANRRRRGWGWYFP